MSDSIISRTKAKAMVQKYQSLPEGSANPNTGQVQPLTKFVHFTFAQFFELLTMNGIITNSDTVSTILQNKSNFGIKLYFAQHSEASDCPNNDPNQVGSNTIVMVNTVRKNSIWYDMPEAGLNISELHEFATPNSGKAADKGNKCLPECTSFANNL